MNSGNRHRNRKKLLIQNLVLLSCSLLFIFLVLEAVFRIQAYRTDSKLIRSREVLLEKLTKGDYSEYLFTDAFGPMIRLSSNDRISFELKPNLKWEYVGAEVRTSSQGFRDSLYPYEKPPGTVRIFGIGDSIMFGQGVDQEKNYLAVLENALNRNSKDRKWEAINSGVPDYNTFIEVETLADKGLRFSPDIVILGFCSNDIELPMVVFNLGLEGEFTLRDYLLMDISYLAMFVMNRLDRSLPDRPWLPNKNMDRGGGSSLAGSLKRLHSLKQEHGFDVIVLFLTPKKGPVDKEFMRIARALDFHIVDMEDDISAYMKRMGISDYYGSELTVPDNHPSEITHRMTADKLLNYIEQKGLGKALP